MDIGRGAGSGDQEDTFIGADLRSTSHHSSVRTPSLGAGELRELILGRYSEAAVSWNLCIFLNLYRLMIRV